VGCPGLTRPLDAFAGFHSSKSYHTFCRFRGNRKTAVPDSTGSNEVLFGTKRAGVEVEEDCPQDLRLFSFHESQNMRKTGSSESNQKGCHLTGFTNEPPVLYTVMRGVASSIHTMGSMHWSTKRHRETNDRAMWAGTVRRRANRMHRKVNQHRPKGYDKRAKSRKPVLLRIPGDASPVGVKVGQYPRS
jgi:hypothetical protein